MLVEIINRQRSQKIAKKEWKEFAIDVLKELNLENIEVSIVFVSDQKIQELNRDFRSIDKATDVLSFSYQDVANTEDNKLLKENFYENIVNSTSNYLGDVVISTHTAVIYAQKLGLTFDQEIKTLILHGLLHLCGYDHETDNGEMDELEQKLRKQLLGFEFLPNTSVIS
ncbi:MAG: rRNA maturation RNase YbeY [Blastocatellia bacterium]|nr:rRNA maturation RNase YbeY [Blastocatellia bacterium]MBL8193750.1 rRNA maturation RNase YbeY [Blastocatellia bacterium]MBN8723856.1 rRNA maturation RNase YbeY [Acidobacteriota bacterium]